MFHSSPARWLAALSAVAALSAMAQPAPDPAAPAPGRAPDVLIYKSPFEGYRRYAEEPSIPWKEANDTVQRRGGWRAYAKEAAGASGGGAADPHAGHAMPMAPKEKQP